MSISTNIISTTSTKTIKIRHGRNEDLDAIEDIVSKVVKMMNADGNFQWDEVYPLRCHFAQDIIDGNCYVAEEISIENDEGVIRSSRILGMAALTEDQSPEYADVGWDLSIPSVVMHRAAVCPSAQRSGIGSLFFNKSEELARERGYHVVRIDTNKLNLRMQGAIKKAGYTYSGEICLLSKPADMRFVCFEKWLAPI